MTPICHVKHLDGSVRTATAYVDGEPVCESCSRALLALKNDVQPLLFVLPPAHEQPALLTEVEG